MPVFLLSVMAVVLASGAGTVVALIVAGIPLDVLSRAALGGRYAGLTAGDPTSPVGPSSGRRIPAFAARLGAAA